jgi:hypothetical protein
MGWDEVPCNTPSGPYINFKINKYRCCDGDWIDAICYHNAIILWARAGNATQWNNVLSNCYWKQYLYCPDSYSFVTTPYNKDVYFVSITNSKCDFPGHAVVGELIEGEITDFSHWKFFQWGDLNITPGSYQMPLGCIVHEEWGDIEYQTKVEIQRITSLSIVDCAIVKEYVVVITFYISATGVISYTLPD